MIRVSRWVVHFTADVSTVNAAHQLSLSLLTVSHVSHSISQSRVCSDQKLFLMQLVTSCSSNFLALVCSRIVAVPCLLTKQVSRVTCASYCMLWRYNFYHSCSSVQLQGFTDTRYLNDLDPAQNTRESLRVLEASLITAVTMVTGSRQE